jgi:hypothetical protein
MKIGLTGYSRVGKDVIADRLCSRHEFIRVAIGDYIKEDLAALLIEHLGIDPRETTGPEKERIRPLLECWGDVNFTKLLDTMRQDIADPFNRDLVNSRICRVEESRMWVESGGVMVWVHRQGVQAATTWEVDRMDDLIENDIPMLRLVNDSTVEALHAAVDDICVNFSGFDLCAPVFTSKYAATHRLPT